MMKDKKIVIAGGSGFIGQAMAQRWCADNEVIILTRGKAGEANNRYEGQTSIAAVQYEQWDGATMGDWAKALEGCDVLINLAGRSVNCRYNEANKAEILSSRIRSTAVLGKGVQECANPPKLWINGGSATIYPHATTSPRDESFTDFADDFSVQVCRAWEQAFNAISLERTRKVILRMAITIGEGGVIVPYRRLVMAGLGGAQGSGKQMFSWIHVEDLCRIVEWLQEHPKQEGVFNAAAPKPINNAAFMATLRKVLHVPFGLPAPAWLLRLGARIIGTETELILKSRWVLPGRLFKEGFRFQYADIEDALRHL
jgi:uncharacterized protein (TIGR01777 family)